MRSGAVVAVVALLAVAGAAAYVMIDVDQVREARLPAVDVDVSGGQLPAFDAEVGTIEMTTEETTVTVPDVTITTQEKTVEVPSLDIVPPGENES